MDVDTVKALMSKLVQELGEMLGRHGFGREQAYKLDEFKVYEWHADRGWRHDVVSVLLSRSLPDRVIVKYEVSIPCPPGGPILLDGVGLSSRTSGLRFPSGLRWFRDYRTQRYVKHVVPEIESGLGWFNKYSTPSECLRLLEAGETNLGMSRGPKTLVLMNRLSSLAAAAADKGSGLDD